MVQDSSTSAMAENLDTASEMEVPATKSENDEMGQWHLQFSFYAISVGPSRFHHFASKGLLANEERQ